MKQDRKKEIKMLTKDQVLENLHKEKIYSLIYDELMYYQQLYSEDVKINGYRYHDNYNSFYLTVKNASEIIESFYNNKEYFNAVIEKKIEKAYKALNTFNFMEYDNKQYDNLEEYIERKANELLKVYEKELHEYENPSDELLEDIIECMIENGVFDNYKVKNDELYLHHQRQVIKAYDEKIS